jgi:hypothetical protein
MRFIEIDDVSVPVEANLGIRQTYEPVRARQVKRYVSGAAVRLMSNVPRKIKTTISSSGENYHPDGFDGIDWDAVLTLKCAEPRSVTGVGGSNVITLPAARRSDFGYEPKGWAKKANGRRVSSPVSPSGDVYTVTTVAGAVSYQVSYYPEISVLAEKKNTGDLGWTITAEEV